MQETATRSAGPRPYQFTVADYYRMAETGILKDDDRVELIEGEIVMMPPIDFIHSQGTHESQKKLFQLALGTYDVRCQHPVRLSATNEPVPDIAVVKPIRLTGHPGPDETFIILEVANTSLEEDLGRKRLMYAAAAIPEYWVLDVVGCQLHQFTKPREGDYHEHRILAADEEVRSVILPQVVAQVAELLPS